MTMFGTVYYDTIHSYFCYAPTIKWPGAYNITPFRPFVIINFPFIISVTVAQCTHSTQIWYMFIRICHRNMQVKFELGSGSMIFDRVIILELYRKKNLLCKEMSKTKYSIWNFGCPIHLVLPSQLHVSFSSRSSQETQLDSKKRLQILFTTDQSCTFSYGISYLIWNN